MKCKKYVIIKEGYKAQQAVKLFERDHAGHFLGTVDYNEVRDGYESHTNEYMDKVQ